MPAERFSADRASKFRSLIAGLKELGLSSPTNLKLYKLLGHNAWGFLPDAVCTRLTQWSVEQCIPRITHYDLRVNTAAAIYPDYPVGRDARPRLPAKRYDGFRNTKIFFKRGKLPRNHTTLVDLSAALGTRASLPTKWFVVNHQNGERTLRSEADVADIARSDLYGPTEYRINKLLAKRRQGGVEITAQHQADGDVLYNPDAGRTDHELRFKKSGDDTAKTATVCEEKAVGHLDGLIKALMDMSKMCAYADAPRLIPRQCSRMAAVVPQLLEYISDSECLYNMVSDKRTTVFMTWSIRDQGTLEDGPFNCEWVPATNDTEAHKLLFNMVHTSVQSMLE